MKKQQKISYIAVWFFGILSVIFFASSVFAAQAFAKVQVSITGRISGERFNLGVGSKIRLNLGAGRAAVDGLFLGRIVEAGGRSDEYLFLDLQKTRAYLIDYGNTQFTQEPGRRQTVLRPMDQFGGTCTAFAFTHFWQQYVLGGLRGNEELSNMMASERSRTKFLEENISRYYLGRPIEIPAVMKTYGSRFGVTCRSKKFSTGKDAADYLYRYAKAGIPVMVDFNIGPNMVNSTYETVDFEKPSTVDSRLWVPRRVGERNSGGHVVVAAAGFIAHGRRKLMVLDSDWDQPRIWDLDKYLGERLAVKELSLTACGGLLQE